MREAIRLGAAPHVSSDRPSSTKSSPAIIAHGQDTSTQRPSVLIVEDDALLAIALADALVAASFEVVATVASAEEAFAAVEKCIPDVILMDIRLKGTIDGIEVARRLCSKHDLKVLFITGHSDSVTRARAEQLKPAGFLVKPVATERVIAAVRAALASRH